MNEKKKRVKDQILASLAQSTTGLTQSQLSEQLKVSRQTIKKYLDELKADGEIQAAVIGAYTLYVLRPAPDAGAGAKPAGSQSLANPGETFLSPASLPLEHRLASFASTLGIMQSTLASLERKITTIEGALGDVKATLHEIQQHQSPVLTPPVQTQVTPALLVPEPPPNPALPESMPSSPLIPPHTASEIHPPPRAIPAGEQEHHGKARGTGKPWTCASCNEVFRTSEDLKRHRKVCAKAKADRTCPHCGRVYREITTLQWHVKTCATVPGTDNASPPSRANPPSPLATVPPVASSVPSVSEAKEGVLVGSTPSVRPLEPIAGQIPILSRLAAILESGNHGGENMLETFRLRVGAAAMQCAAASPRLASILARTRVDPYPYQVFVADRVTRHGYPRCILADEVGLGKTIEAGLAIKVLSARNLAKRVLLIVPASLARQWQSEMHKKFNEAFALWDRHEVRRAKGVEVKINPWKTTNRAIVSLQYARQAHVADQLMAVPWDVVVFDEAHHLRAHASAPPSLGYKLAERLGGRCRGLLLLTATPMQLAPYELFSLLHLLDPDRFAGFEAFESFRKHIPEASAVVDELASFNTKGKEVQAKTLARLQVLLSAPGKKTVPVETLREMVLSQPQQRQEILETIASKHTFSDLIIRNRKRVVMAGTGPDPRRALHDVVVHLTPGEERVYKAIRAYIAEAYNRAVADSNNALGFVMVTLQKLLASSQAALAATLGRIVARMRVALPARGHARREAAPSRGSAAAHAAALGATQLPVLTRFLAELHALPVDTKMHALADLVKKQCEAPGAKVLVFTQFRRTLEVIAQNLTVDGLRVTTFHGGLDAGEKDRHAEEFRSTAQVMVSTEAGGEGRNFQFCHVLVNYDLPWNPMKVEQRIGRLDRLGQTQTVDVHNFYIAGTVEADVIRALVDRVMLFEGTIGGLEPILERVERRVQDVILSPREDFARVEASKLDDQLDRDVQRARRREQRINDALMDQRSFEPARANQLLKEVPSTLNGEVTRFLRAFATTALPPGVTKGDWDGAIEFTVPPGLLPAFPGAPIPAGIQGTLDPVLARQRDDLDFFCPGHPLVDSATTFCMHPSFGGDAVAIRACNDGVFGNGAGEGILWVFSAIFGGSFTKQDLIGAFVPKGGTLDVEAGNRFLAAIRAGAAKLEAVPAGTIFPADWSVEVASSIARARAGIQPLLKEHLKSMRAAGDTMAQQDLRQVDHLRAQATSSLDTRLTIKRQKYTDMTNRRLAVGPGAKAAALAIQARQLDLEIQELEAKIKHAAAPFDLMERQARQPPVATVNLTLVAACIIASPSPGEIRLPVPQQQSPAQPAQASVITSLKAVPPAIPAPAFPPPRLGKTRVPCPTCGTLFPNAGAMKSHHKACQLGLRFDCPRCGAQFTTKKALERHLSTCGRNDHGELPCRYCGRGFRNANLWRQHEQACAGAAGDKVRGGGQGAPKGDGNIQAGTLEPLNPVQKAPVREGKLAGSTEGGAGQGSVNDAGRSAQSPDPAAPLSLENRATLSGPVLVPPVPTSPPPGPTQDEIVSPVVARVGRNGRLYIQGRYYTLGQELASWPVRVTRRGDTLDVTDAHGEALATIHEPTRLVTLAPLACQTVQDKAPPPNFLDAFCKVLELPDEVRNKAREIPRTRFFRTLKGWSGQELAVASILGACQETGTPLPLARVRQLCGIDLKEKVAPILRAYNHHGGPTPSPPTLPDLNFPGASDETLKRKLDEKGMLWFQHHRYPLSPRNARREVLVMVRGEFLAVFDAAEKTILASIFLPTGKVSLRPRVTEAQAKNSTQPGADGVVQEKIVNLERKADAPEVTPPAIPVVAVSPPGLPRVEANVPSKGARPGPTTPPSIPGHRFMPVVDVRKTRRFLKGISRYRPDPGRLGEIIARIREDPAAGDKLHAPSFRGIRHIEMVHKFQVFYAFCPEALESRPAGSCQWCPEGSHCQADPRVYLLNFEPNRILDHLH